MSRYICEAREIVEPTCHGLTIIYRILCSSTRDSYVLGGLKVPELVDVVCCSAVIMCKFKLLQASKIASHGSVSTYDQPVGPCHMASYIALGQTIVQVYNPTWITCVTMCIWT